MGTVLTKEDTSKRSYTSHIRCHPSIENCLNCKLPTCTGGSLPSSTPEESAIVRAAIGRERKKDDELPKKRKKRTLTPEQRERANAHKRTPEYRARERERDRAKRAEARANNPDMPLPGRPTIYATEDEAREAHRQREYARYQLKKNDPEYMEHRRERRRLARIRKSEETVKLNEAS